MPAMQSYSNKQTNNFMRRRLPTQKLNSALSPYQQSDYSQSSVR